MTPQQASASYRRFLTDKVALVRAGAVGAYVAARVMGAEPAQMAGNVQQFERKVVILASAAAAAWALPLVAKQDRLRWGDKTLVVQSVDDATRRVGDTLIAYDVRVTGA